MATDATGRFLVFGALALAAYALVGRARAATTMKARSKDDVAANPSGQVVPHDRGAAKHPGRVVPPRVEQWATYLAPGCLAHGIQLPYALRWIEIESGGNPCACGYPAARGPDGHPRELGIAQLYNPDDLRRLGVTGAQLRAYCVPGSDHPVKFKGKVVRGFSSVLSRQLTTEEMQDQADATIKLIVHCMLTAARDLAKVNAGAAWSLSRRNYWALVKLQHALPGLSR